MLKFENLDLYQLGNSITIAGLLLQGQGKTLALYLPEATPDTVTGVTMSQEDWVKFLAQVDTLETKLFPNSTTPKIIVRKSQRIIEQGESWKVFKRDSYTCRYCANGDTPLTVDHLILWENMGQSVKENLITACRKCNKTRANTEFEDWIKTEFYQKNIQNFPDPVQAHKYNMAIWEKAKHLPIRTTKRGR